MIEIKDLLVDFEKLLGAGEFKKELIKDILFEVVGIKIETKDIKIENGDLFLNIKPIYKNEIFLKRENILNKLRQNISSQQLKEIR